MSKHLNFRLERIIALDPARPLIRPGNQNRLDSGDARSVQVIHTNAGYYGEAGRIGHIDFCVNGGRRCELALIDLLDIRLWNVIIAIFRRQPFCTNTTNVNLCSHIWSVCYLAHSVFDKNEIIAEPCLRKCPSGVNLLPTVVKPGRTSKSRYGFALNYGIPFGQFTPKTWFDWKTYWQEVTLANWFLSSFVSFSASGSFCVKGSEPPFCPKHANDIGDRRCCLESPEWNELIWNWSRSNEVFANTFCKSRTVEGWRFSWTIIDSPKLIWINPKADANNLSYVVKVQFRCKTDLLTEKLH